MTHASYNDALFEEEARIAAIYPIGMMGDPENPPEWLTELFEACTSPSDDLFKKLPELHPQAESVYEWADGLIMRSRTGFVVRFEVCTRTYLAPPSTAWMSGWGCYHFRYLYIEAFDEIGPTVLAAVRAYHEASRLKAGAP